MAMDEKAQGLIFDIQDYGVADGPGVRTVVFLKGCLLRCPWCANPEGQRQEAELMHSRHRCRKCHGCMEACSKNAISINQDGFPIFDRRICLKCKDKSCATVCSAKASRIVGSSTRAGDLYNRVKQSSLFFRNSGGGVTLSGGEPLLQGAFVRDFLRECGKTGLSVGVESCGMFDWEGVEPFIGQFDFFYFDLKCMELMLHQKFIGAENKKILVNLETLARTAADKITVTIPVIPGFNDTEENIRMTARCCKQLRIKRIRLLPYHSMGAGKYEELGRDYPMNDKAALSSGLLEELKIIVTDEGIACLTS